MLESPLFYAAIGLGAASIVALFLYAGHTLKKRATARAFELFRKGSSSIEIEQQLVAEGCDAQMASNVVQKVVKRIMLAHPLASLEAGQSQEDILKDMVSRGIEATQAERLIGEAALLRWGRRWRFLLVPVGLAVCVVGVCVIFFGLILRDGNRTGKWVTFPFAGGLTILTGTAITILGVCLLAVVFAKTL